jgi:hypothetical protein
MQTEARELSYRTPAFALTGRLAVLNILSLID